MESCGNDPGIYRLLPLSCINKQIRLLHVVRNGSKDLNYELSVHYITEAPEYDAISYVWGEPGGANTISVNGAAVHVRDNCFYALQQADVVSRYIWIDSVCIDQANLKEKSVQVSMMYRIFCSADRVLACVGAADHSSDRIIAEMSDIHWQAYSIVLEEHHRYGRYQKPSAWSDWADGTAWEKSQNEALHHRYHSWRRWAGTRIKDLCMTFCQDYNNLTSRPYFRRLWTLQELYAGDSVTFLLGRDSFSLWLLRDVNSAAHGMRSVLRWLANPVYGEENYHLRYDLYAATPKPTFPTLDLFRAVKQVYPLMHFKYTRHLLCQDSRDRVYGTLGLLTESRAFRNNPLVPDYSKTSFDLSVELLTRFTVDEVDSVTRLHVDDVSDVVLALEVEMHDPQLADSFAAGGSGPIQPDSQRRQWELGMDYECSLDAIEPYRPQCGGNTAVEQLSQSDKCHSLQESNSVLFHKHCQQMLDSGDIVKAFGTRHGCHFEYLVPRSARKEDVVLVANTIHHDEVFLGLVCRYIPGLRKMRLIGFASAMSVSTTMVSPGESLSYKVVFEASASEMMVLFVLPKGHPKHARLLFRPPQVRSIVMYSENVGP